MKRKAKVIIQRQGAAEEEGWREIRVGKMEGKILGGVRSSFTASEAAADGANATFGTRRCDPAESIRAMTA
jgi:hypothetical protein